MLSIYGRCTRQFKIGSQLRFFLRRIERRPKQIVLIHFLEYQKCNFIDRKKTKSNKKATRACLKVCRQTHENTWNQSTLTSYERRQVLFLHDSEAIRPSSHSPIDNCGMFIRHQEYKSQVTCYKYRLCSHSLEQSRRQYSFILVQQNQLVASNNFITSDRGNSFSPLFLLL